MISEQITITTSPQTLKDLIEAARPGTTIPDKCVGVMLRQDIAAITTITLADSNSGSGAVILSGAEQLYNISFQQIKTSLALLSCDTGEATVHVIIEQDLI